MSEGTATMLTITTPATEDGAVLVRVVKMGAWVLPKYRYHDANVGLSVEPHGQLLVEIPIENVKEGDHLDVGQVAELLNKILDMSLPACSVFVEHAGRDFTEQEDSF